MIIGQSEDSVVTAVLGLNVRLVSSRRDLSLVDGVHELAWSSSELGQVVDILFGLVEASLATGFVQSGTGVGADHRDVSLGVNHHNGQVTALDHMAERLNLLTVTGHAVKDSLHHGAVWQVSLEHTRVKGP